MAKPGNPLYWRRNGVLLGFSILFIASVVLRLGSFEIPLIAPASASDPEPGPSLIGPTSPIRAAMDEVAALQNRLTERETELNDRERAIDAAQILVEERLSELEAAEMRLEALIQVSDEAAEGDLARLTEVYEAMEPDQAAALFSQMESNFAAGFLTRMSPAASSAIMAELDPEIGYAISVVIATRNAAAPTMLPPDPDPES